MKTVLAAGVRGELPETERGQKFAWHSLRAGLASSAEVDERYVQRQLGHTSAAATGFASTSPKQQGYKSGPCPIGVLASAMVRRWQHFSQYRLGYRKTVSNKMGVSRQDHELAYRRGDKLRIEPGEPIQRHGNLLRKGL